MSARLAATSSGVIGVLRTWRYAITPGSVSLMSRLVKFGSEADSQTCRDHYLMIVTQLMPSLMR